jgi:hypothetical protein
MKKTKKVGIVVITVEGLEKALGIDTSRNRIIGYWEEGCESKFIRLKISGEDCPKVLEGKLPPEIEIETVQKKIRRGK